ncbi:hypothetical protein ACLKA6_016267 [Drosophila palustris]
MVKRCFLLLNIIFVAVIDKNKGLAVLLSAIEDIAALCLCILSLRKKCKNKLKFPDEEEHSCCKKSRRASHEAVQNRK